MDVKIEILRPPKSWLNWALEIIVDNLKPYLNFGFLKSSKKKSLSNPKTRFIFAIAQNTPVGVCTFRIQNREAFIYEIHVEKNYRSRSLGTKLIDYLKLKVSKKANKIALQVHRNNLRAIEFYEKNGFSIQSQSFESNRYHSMEFIFKK